jgi:hypothetical protein
LPTQQGRSTPPPITELVGEATVADPAGEGVAATEHVATLEAVAAAEYEAALEDAEHTL